MAGSRLRVGGLARLSTCDWPDHLTATVFLQGCPWRCGYCHNPHLIPATAGEGPEWPEIMAFLARRRGLLDGVVFSGGEPTLQGELVGAVRAVRGLGFAVGLHTAGPYPERLSALLPLLDWVGFDVKATFAGYDAVTGVVGSGDRAAESLRRLLASGVDYEVRTTVHPDLLRGEDLDLLARQLQTLGVRRYVTQVFRAQGCADPVLAAATGPSAVLSTSRAAAFEHHAVR